MSSSFQTLKLDYYDANMDLTALGLVIHTFGNVSAVDRAQKVFAIKPSGVPYPQLKAEDMVIVDFDNNIIEGKLKPSSDTPTHAYLYKSWETLGGIAHTHALYSVAWAQAQCSIPILGTTHADHLTQDIPCTPPMSDELIEGQYEHNTGIQITDYFSAHQLSPNEIEMILIGSHGPFCWGANASKAVYNSQVLEAVAEMAYLTLQINPKAERLKQALIKKHYDRKHGKNSYYGQD